MADNLTSVGYRLAFRWTDIQRESLSEDSSKPGAATGPYTKVDRPTFSGEQLELGSMGLEG